MKQFFFCISLLLFIATVLSSCSDTVTYADSVAAESSLISDYLKRNKINVITTLPTNASYWSEPGHEKDYYHSATGLYFRLEKVGGSVIDTFLIEKYDLIGARYEAYTLNATPDTTVTNLSVSAFPNPASFVYGSGVYTNVCAAFNEAASYMKRNDAEARLIVPSKIGFSSDAQIVKPMGYRFILYFQ